MLALGEHKHAPDQVDVLTATLAGRSLYVSLGWRDLSAWTAAACPS